MKAKTLLLVLFVATASAAATWFAARHEPAPAAAASTDATGRKILYYQSPMHPWIKSDKPGKCPICGMNMVPVYENGESTNTGFGLKLNADSVNVANVQTATVERRSLVHTLRVAGNIPKNSRAAAWFEFVAYSRDLAWLKAGQTIEVIVPSAPEKTYPAMIKLDDSQPVAGGDFDGASDSVKIRAEISNPPVEAGWPGGEKLFTGFYAEGCVLVSSPDVLTVPRSAVLQSGSQPVVYVDEGKGYYEQRKVKLGRVGDKFVEILDGLQEGDKVVTSGNLLIDAEAQIFQSADN
jgi:multidrug efflux pump subunit AcrA (membrane-fusion protein)